MDCCFPVKLTVNELTSTKSQIAISIQSRSSKVLSKLASSIETLANERVEAEESGDGVGDDEY